MKFNQSNNFMVQNDGSPVKAAIVMAHPDDETIWTGGLLLTQKTWHWKVFIATKYDTEDRPNEFKKAIASYQNYGVSSQDFEFLDVMPDVQEYDRLNKDEIYQKLNIVDLSAYDVIFTHNMDGEYGHGNHKTLGEYLNGKNLNTWHVLCPAIQNPREKLVGEYIETVYIKPDELDRKRTIFQNSYPTQQYLWSGFSDFMTFQFYSGVEMFTRSIALIV